MKNRKTKKAANLRKGDMITCSIRQGSGEAKLKEYIIGYYRTMYKNREVLPVDASRFLALNKKGVFEYSDFKVELHEVDRQKFKYYIKWQWFLDLLDRNLSKLKLKRIKK